MLPNTIVIGAGKAGTTSLWGYLDAHPQVFMAAAKELDFFTTERNWHRGLGWYEDHFEGAGAAVAVGEASGNYTNWPEFAGVPERMASVLPAARLVYLVRHPIDRIISAYRYARVAEGETRPIEEAVWRVGHYLNASRYSTQIERFLEHYPREQLLVITSEDLQDARAITMRRVFTYLGVDPDVDPAAFEHEYNVTARKVLTPRAALRLAAPLPGYHALARRAPTRLKQLVATYAKKPLVTDEESRLTDDLREALEDALRDDVRRLRTHLDGSFHCWGLA